MYCKGCKTEKPADDFYRHQKVVCKSCIRQRYRERMKDPKVRAEYNARQRERMKDPKVRAERNARRRRYYRERRKDVEGPKGL